MARHKKYDFDQLINQLFDELESNPYGLKMPEICERLNVPIRVASKVITMLRIALGDGYSVAIPAIPDGRERIYKLTDNQIENQPWMVMRLKVLQKRMETDVATYKSLVSATDGRTKAGKMVRLQLVSAERLLEDVTMLLEEVEA